LAFAKGMKFHRPAKSSFYVDAAVTPNHNGWGLNGKIM